MVKGSVRAQIERLDWQERHEKMRELLGALGKKKKKLSSTRKPNQANGTVSCSAIKKCKKWSSTRKPNQANGTVSCSVI